MINACRDIARGVAALVLALVVAMPAAADNPDPERAQALVRETTSDMLNVLRNDLEKAENPAALLQRKMNEIVAPHLDFVTMTKLAVGRHWMDASDEQKRALVNEFRTLLLRTYARSLQEYDNEDLELLPLREGDKPNRVKVRSRVISADGPEIAVDYSLRFHNDAWRVYDIVIDGISMVTNYRSTFSSVIRSDGIDGLVETLRKKNAAGEDLESAS